MTAAPIRSRTLRFIATGSIPVPEPAANTIKLATGKGTALVQARFSAPGQYMLRVRADQFGEAVAGGRAASQQGAVDAGFQLGEAQRGQGLFRLVLIRCKLHLQILPAPNHGSPVKSP